MDGNGGTEDREALERLLSDLRSEHRDLDDVIERLGEQAPFDQLRLQRLKKRKLQLRDRIQQVESSLYPDIIA
ncbi:MAG: YdcH family protein [Alphaproteobacteria bacterium]